MIQQLIQRLTSTWQGSEAGFRWGNLVIWQIVFGTKQSPWPLDREVRIMEEHAG